MLNTNEMAELLPNTFLIGAQKAATTSLYHWMSQHPDICAPMSVKDYAFFTRPEFFKKGPSHLNGFYNGEHHLEKIIIQGSVHYIFFEEALKRIHDFKPKAKFILVLRNPFDRAISAYRYAKKFNYETECFEKAIELEKQRLQTSDVRTKSECTYLHHGLYYQQITKFFNYFDKKQLHICFYDDIKLNPKRVIKDIFEFLKVDSSFIPELKKMNKTGRVKNKTFQNIAFGNHPARNFITKKILRNILPEKIRTDLRWKIIKMNTKSAESSSQEQQIPETTLKKMELFFANDISKLEELLQKDLSHWKRN